MGMVEPSPSILGFNVSGPWQGKRVWRESTVCRRAARSRAARTSGVVSRAGFLEGSLPNFIKRAFAKPEAKPNNDRATDLAGADDWLSMAADIGPLEPEKPRDAPQWEYPSGVSPDDFKVDPSGGWSEWQDALQKDEEPGPQRDPREETDFWRGAVSEVLGDAAAPDGEAAPTIDDDSTTNPATGSTIPPSDSKNETLIDKTQSGVWRKAREVTAEVKSLEDKLRDEIGSFDLDSVKETYIPVAKDVIPDSVKEGTAQPTSSSEAGSIQEPPPLGDSETDTGRELEGEADTSGSIADWNPDRDWQRFDDIRRDEAMALEAERRRNATPQSNSAGQPPAPGAAQFEFADDNGNPLSRAEVEAAANEGAVFIDENGKEVPFSDLLSSWPKEDDVAQNLETPQQAAFDEEDIVADPSSFVVPPSPPTMPRKPVSNSMYGSAWSGFDDTVQEMIDAGETLRDPKVDADYWRSAAQELRESLVADDDETSTKAPEVTGEVGSTPTELADVDQEAGEKPAVKLSSNSPNPASSESSDDAPPVDRMWMSAAEEVIQGVEFVENEQEEKFVFPVGNMDELASESASTWDSDEIDSETPSSTVIGPADDLWKSAASEVTTGVEFVENEAVDNIIYPDEDVSLSDDEQKSAWSEWSDASTAWTKDLENAEERDPKKEVDMWRSSAQELVPDSGAEPSKGQSPKSDDDSSDWGSGMGSGSSESSAWNSWNTVQDTSGEASQNTMKKLWWSSRSDGATQNRPGSVSDASEPEFWGDMARKMKDGPAEKSEPETKIVKGIGEDVNVWMDAAKDVTLPEESRTEGGNEGAGETGESAPSL